MDENVGADVGFSAGLIARSGIGGTIEAPAFTYEVVCTGADGVEKWRESFHNTVTNVGKADVINQYFKGSSYSPTFYMGIKGTGSVAAGDTMASHAGWAEVTGYSAGTRPAITFGSTTGTTTASNTATAVTFAINATVTCAGAFITTDSTKSGTSGTLYSAADFGASRSAVSGDTLSVTATVTVS